MEIQVVILILLALAMILSARKSCRANSTIETWFYILLAFTLMSILLVLAQEFGFTPTPEQAEEMKANAPTLEKIQEKIENEISNFE
jgi:hypothetical protein